ncbi:MAG: Trk system potassium transporter TrkA [Erysipelotrichaceae bacterium]|nr:Trk system potassium transporter TrkA [Erysipelotrichaceae bacterium]
MKIVIVGCGKVGRKIADELVKEGHDLVLIDRDAEIVESTCTALDVLGVVGDATDMETLREADIENADVLLAVTESDEKNLLCCLFAKKAGNVKTITRVREPNYDEGINFIREELGLAMAINPERAAANSIASLIKFPNAVEIEQFAKGMVELLGFVVPDNSILVDNEIMNVIPSLNTQVLICGIERGDEVIIPNGHTVIRRGDKVFVIANANKSGEFFEKVGLLPKRIRKAMIVGGSRIAYYLSKELIASRIDVCIIEENKSTCERLAELLPEAHIICGDGSSQELLEEEGIRETEAFVSLTNMDEQNVLLSLYAKNSTNAKTVTKVNHISYDDLISRLDLGSIICPKDITADSITQFVRAMNNASANNVDTLYKILDGNAEALSFTIKEKSEVCDVPLINLDTKDDLLICAIIRNNKVITPSGKDVIKVGDSVVVVTTHKGLSDIKDIVK